MSTPLRTLSLALVPLMGASLLGQTGQLAGPSIGFVFDGTAHALRVVLGTPGASTLSDPLALGVSLTWAAIAPQQDSAVAMAGDGSLHFFRLSGGTAVEQACSGCPSSAEGAVFSPSGTAVAVYAAGRAQVLTGLPAAPVAGAAFDFGGSGRVHMAAAPSLAVSDDGTVLLVSKASSVDVYSAPGGMRTLVRSKPFPVVAFAPGGHDAVVADAAASRMVVFRDVAGAATPMPLTVPDGVVRSVRGLAFSADGARVLLANPASQSVNLVDVASSALTALPCACMLTGVTRMGSVFRLNEAGDGPVWLLDSGTSGSRVVFVPGVAAATAN